MQMFILCEYNVVCCCTISVQNKTAIEFRQTKQRPETFAQILIKSYYNIVS